MTTLGFGDLHAAPGSHAGHMLLMVQVLLGYYLLAALVVRLGILFQSVPGTDRTEQEATGQIPAAGTVGDE